MDMERTHITIRSDQKEAVEDRNLNLSAFVRDELDDWMDG
jgi:hypothetical protein